MARGAYPLATDMAFEVNPGTTRILLRANPYSDNRAVCSVEIHRKSGTSLSTSEAAVSSGRAVRTGAALFAAQRFTEGGHERSSGGIGGVVGNRRIARRRTGNQDAPGLAVDH